MYCFDKFSTLMAMRFPVVLFDFDGTVIDSGSIIIASMRHATKTVLGRDIPEDELGRAVGGDGPVERVGSSPIFAGEAVVTRLLAGLRSLDHSLVLVIDDLHELHSREALELLEVFVAQLPPTTRLVLGTREDPGLGLHRLRVAGMLVELDGSDLAFSAEEARALLEAGGVKLSRESMALLSDRTEGWAAGLRLAVLSLSGHPDPDRFVREFSGSERTVAAYLMAEVLERQPADVRQLLLRTSVLERVSGPLADHLTGSSGSEGILQRLADANTFVTPLDAGRTWFRYHHLFADLLRMELRRTAPGMTAELHRAAAEWHEQHGNVVEAIRHAQDAGEWSRAVPEKTTTAPQSGRTTHAPAWSMGSGLCSNPTQVSFESGWSLMVAMVGPRSASCGPPIICGCAVR